MRGHAVEGRQRLEAAVAADSRPIGTSEYSWLASGNGTTMPAIRDALPDADFAEAWEAG